MKQDQNTEDAQFLETLETIFERLDVPEDLRASLRPDGEISGETLSGAYELLFSEDLVTLAAQFHCGEMTQEERNEALTSPFRQEQYHNDFTSLYPSLITESDSSLDGIIRSRTLENGEVQSRKEYAAELRKHQKGGYSTIARLVDFANQAGGAYWGYSSEELYKELMQSAYGTSSWEEVREQLYRPVRHTVQSIVMLMVLRQAEINNMAAQFETDKGQFFRTHFDTSDEDLSKLKDTTLIKTPLALAIVTGEEGKNCLTQSTDASGVFLLKSLHLIVLSDKHLKNEERFNEILYHEVIHSLFHNVVDPKKLRSHFFGPGEANGSFHLALTTRSPLHHLEYALQRVQDEAIAYAHSRRGHDYISNRITGGAELYAEYLLDPECETGFGKRTEGLSPQAQVTGIASDMRWLRQHTSTYLDTVKILYGAQKEGRLSLTDSELLVTLLATRARKSKSIEALRENVDSEYLWQKTTDHNALSSEFKDTIAPLYHYSKLREGINQTPPNLELANKHLKLLLDEALQYLKDLEPDKVMSRPTEFLLSVTKGLTPDKDGKVKELAWAPDHETDLAMATTKYAIHFVLSGLDIERLSSLSMSLHLIDDSYYSQILLEGLESGATLFFPGNEEELQDYMLAREQVSDFLNSPPSSVTEEVRAQGAVTLQKMDTILAKREALLNQS